MILCGDQLVWFRNELQRDGSKQKFHEIRELMRFFAAQRIVITHRRFGTTPRCCLQETGSPCRILLGLRDPEGGNNGLSGNVSTKLVRRCVKSQKSADLIGLAAEALNYKQVDDPSV